MKTGLSSHTYLPTFFFLFQPASCSKRGKKGKPSEAFWWYEGESNENLKLHVASEAAKFTLLLRRLVGVLHRTATCRPLLKPWVSLLSTYYRAVFRIFIALLRFSVDSSVIILKQVWTVFWSLLHSGNSHSVFFWRKQFQSFRGSSNLERWICKMSQNWGV